MLKDGVNVNQRRFGGRVHPGRNYGFGVSRPCFE
jgi:hypothetical protein